MSRPLASLALLASAAALYAGAALMTRSGFYDGFGPIAGYCWVKAPPGVIGCGKPPRGGSWTASVTGGVVDPGSAFTADGQAEFSWKPGAFTVSPGTTSVVIKLEPAAAYPTPRGIKLLTNVYLVTATAPLNSVGGLVTLRYSADVPSPSIVYAVPPGGSSWRSLGSTQASAPYSISANTRTLGYFAAGYASGKAPAGPPPGAGGQGGFPLLLVLIVVLILVAALPLLFLARRRDEEEG